MSLFFNAYKKQVDMRLKVGKKTNFMYKINVYSSLSLQ